MILWLADAEDVELNVGIAGLVVVVGSLEKTALLIVLGGVLAVLMLEKL